MKKILVFILLQIIILPLCAQQKVDLFISKNIESLLKTYQSIHQFPELSGQEERTAAAVADHLRQAGYEVKTNLGKFSGRPWKGYGVVGLLRNGSGPIVMIRADMDALPMEEKTNLPYRSQVKITDNLNKLIPVMHACGHDIHTALLMGAAEFFANNKDLWKGTLLVVAQPSEEGGPGASGAEALILDGLFTRFPVPDYILGLHQTPELATGSVGIISGYSTSTNAMGEIIVKGVSGHPAKPHNAKDAIVISAALIQQLQTITSRETNPVQPATLTIGSIHGGTAANIICDEVTLKISLRALNESVLDSMLASIKRMARGIAIANGLPEDKYPVVNITKGYPANYNDPILAERIKALFIKIFGDSAVLSLPPSMTGEDFAYYTKTIHKPSLFFQIGGADRDKFKESLQTGKMLPSNHSPNMAPEPRGTLSTGMKAMVSAALELLKPKNK